MTSVLGFGGNRRPSLFQCLVVACLYLLSGCVNPLAPKQTSLTGSWSGDALIGLGLDTPLRMELTDKGGVISGTGGASFIDCKFFVYCGSFADFTVSGTRKGFQVVLDGNSIYGASWQLFGSIDSSGDALSGTGTGNDIEADFQDFSWSMERVICLIC